MKHPATHITASKRNGTRYTDVAANLPRRVQDLKQGFTHGFTQRYGCAIFVWYEAYPTMPDAVVGEKQIAAGLRGKTLPRVEAMNTDWLDLTADLA